MSEVASEVYARRLLPKGHGYPLWVPEPYVQQYREKGISIGDVGVITTSGAFNFFFNICLPLDDPVNRRAPADMEVVELVDHDDVITLPHMHTKGGYVASSSMEKKKLSGSAAAPANGLIPVGVGAGVSFESSISDGAVLLVPDGSARYDLDSIDKLRDQALIHGSRWYQHINGTLGKAITEGSLYLVTGCDKAKSWGVASFSSSSERTEISFNLSASQATEGNALYVHSWETSSPASVRIGPTLDRGQIFKENQCVFIRGFKVSVRTGTWAKLLGPVKLTSILDAKPSSLLPSSRGNYTPFASGISQPNGGARTGSGPSDHNYLAHDDVNMDSLGMLHDNISVVSFPAQIIPYHPSTLINDFLLKAVPEVNVAVTHDSEWFAVYDEDERLLNDEELLRRMNDRYSPQITSHGVFFAPKTSQSAIPSDATNASVAMESSTHSTDTCSSNHTKVEPLSRPTFNFALPLLRSAPFPVPNYETESAPLSGTPVTESERLDQADQHDSTSFPSRQPAPTSSATHLPPQLARDSSSEKRQERKGLGLSKRLANNAGLRSPGEVEPSKKVLREKHPAHVIPVAMEDLTAEDVIVAVMGPTGAGKSSFIRLATGGDVTVGHDLEPCTADIQIFKLHYPSRPDLDIVFVDTPGLDIDEEKIVDWLKATYERDIKLAGILYLHRITDNHLAITAFRILRMFKALCELIALRNVTLTTTMWDNVDGEIGSQRQKELEQTYWKGMIDRGSKIGCYRNSPESAWEILDHCLRTASHPPSVKKNVSVSPSPFTTSLRDFWKGLVARRVKAEDLSNQDIIILVIGPTGAGKSTFINTAVGGNELPVGHGLASCTGKVQGVKCHDPRSEAGRNIIFVDTPAFNHGAKNQMEVARTIKEWLTKTYARKIKVAGIIYLHRISDVRMTERPLTHLKAFEKMCGGGNFPEKILLVTTMWSLVDERTGSHREEELRRKYWSSMMACGSDMMRFEDMEDTESAWCAVNLLLEG